MKSELNEVRSQNGKRNNTMKKKLKSTIPQFHDGTFGFYESTFRQIKGLPITTNGPRWYSHEVSPELDARNGSTLGYSTIVLLP